MATGQDLGQPGVPGEGTAGHRIAGASDVSLRALGVCRTWPPRDWGLGGRRQGQDGSGLSGAGGGQVGQRRGLGTQHRTTAAKQVRPVAPELPGDGAVPKAPSPRSPGSAPPGGRWGDRGGDEEDEGVAAGAGEQVCGRPRQPRGRGAMARQRGGESPSFVLGLTGTSRGVPRGDHPVFANTGTAAAASWRKLGCTARAACPPALPGQGGASTISSPRQRMGAAGRTGGGLLRNGKKASSFPGPRPNFLQKKSCALQTSGLLRQEAGAGGSLSVAPKQLLKGQRPGVCPAGTHRAACTQANTRHASTSSARRPPRGARTGARGPPGSPRAAGVSVTCG